MIGILCFIGFGIGLGTWLASLISEDDSPRDSTIAGTGFAIILVLLGLFL